MTEESLNRNCQTRSDDHLRSRPILITLAGNHSLGGGVAFNLLASSVEPQANAPEETEEEQEEEKSEKNGAPAVVAGVRKKLFIPAEEVLDSARVAAEVVMKDAMEALQRTKQRLMEILHRNPSSQTPPAADAVTQANANEQDDNQQNERTKAKDIVSIFSGQQPAPRINSRL